MSPCHKFQKCACLISTLGFIVALNYGAIMKNKMCVLYEFKNYVSNGATVIESTDGKTKSQCMSSCVHYDTCTTFHFQTSGGKCELLESSEGCMSYDFTIDSIFVQLTKCNGVPPWKVVSPVLQKLQWKNPRDVGDRKVLRPYKGRYVARTFYRGIYLPGYVKDNNMLYVVDMNHKRIACSLFVEILTCVNSSDYTWLEYEPGESIPSSAGVGGFGQGGTPLYVVTVKLFDWKPGYYSDDTKQLYVKRSTKNTNFKAVKMLAEKWFYLSKFNGPNQNRCRVAG